MKLAPKGAAASLLLLVGSLSAPASADETSEPTRAITIRERAPAMSASEVVVDAEELARTNRRSSDDLLRAAPGVHVVQHGSDGKGPQLFLRGFDAAHGADVEVRLDGVPLNEPANIHGHGYLDLGLVIPELVSSVALQPGAFALDQGPFAVAGSLALSTGVAARGLTLRYELGDTHRHRLVAQYAEGPSSPESYSALELLHDDGFGPRRSHERVAFARREAWQVGGARVDVGALGAASFFELPGAVRASDVEEGRIGLYESYFDDGSGASVQGLVHAGARFSAYPWRGRVRAWTRMRHLRLDDNYTGALVDERGDRFLQRESSWGSGATLRGSAALFPRTRLYGLVEGRSSLVAQSDHRLSLDGALLERTRADRFSYSLASAGLGVIGTWLPGVRLDLGLRADAATVLHLDKTPLLTGPFATAALSPRARLSLPTGLPGLRAFVSFGRGVRPPEVGSWPLDAAPLAFPGISVAEEAEAGLRYRTADGRIDVLAAAWGSYVSAEVLFDHPTGTTLSTSASRRLGADLGLSLSPLPGLAFGMNLSAVDARFVTDDEDTPWLDGEPVPGVPPLLALLHGSWERGPLLLSARARGLSSRPLRFGASSPGVLVLDGLARYTVGPIALDLQVDNALDARYAEGAYSYASRWHRDDVSELPSIHVVPGAPRLVRLGLSYTF